MRLTIMCNHRRRLSLLALTLFLVSCGSPAQLGVEPGTAMSSPAGSMVPARTADPAQAALPQDARSPTMTPRIERDTHTPPSDTRTIRGTVLTADGMPIEEAAIDLDPLDTNGLPFEMIAIFSDARGQYHWDVRPGRYRLTVMAAGYQSATQELVITADEPVTVTTVLVANGGQERPRHTKI